MRRFVAGLLVASLVGLTAACSGSTDAGTASTGSAGTATVTCHAVSGSDDVGQRLTFTGCTGPTGGSAVLMGPLASPTIIHWASGGTTQLVFDSDIQQTGNPACPSQLTVMNGQVVASSAAGIAGAVHGTFCIDATRAVTLAPGADFTL